MNSIGWGYQNAKSQTGKTKTKNQKMEPARSKPKQTQKQSKLINKKQ